MHLISLYQKGEKDSAFTVAGCERLSVTEMEVIIFLAATNKQMTEEVITEVLTRLAMIHNTMKYIWEKKPHLVDDVFTFVTDIKR